MVCWAWHAFSPYLPVPTLSHFPARLFLLHICGGPHSTLAKNAALASKVFVFVSGPFNLVAVVGEMSSSTGIRLVNVPVFYGSSAKVGDRRLKIAEVALRFVIIGFEVLSATLMGSDPQVRQIFTVEKRAKFTDMKTRVKISVFSVYFSLEK